MSALRVLPAIMARILVDRATCCWLFQGELNADGFGVIGSGDDSRLTHAVVWEILRGAPSDGRVLAHTCRNRACCNPEHLEMAVAAPVRGPLFGVLAGEPELIGIRCADGGKCHHRCVDACSRRSACVPLSGSGLGADWSGPAG